MSWTTQQLHEELASYYARFRGITAPFNSYVKSLWEAIDTAERADR